MHEHTPESSADTAQPLPLDPPLTAEQARVLGSLIEKESTTPESYPLTLNAAVTACNQKSSRNPVMKLDPGRVAQALRQLQQRKLTESEYGARAERWLHRLDDALKVTKPQRVLLGLLLLRGPQTLAELYTRSERMHGFDDLEDVEYQLQRLAAHEPAFTLKLPRVPGQREDRWMHRLAGEPDPAKWAVPAARASAPAEDDELRARVDELEARVARIEQALSLGSGNDGGPA
ncbi:MAG: YceH family protein [Wenzhouxiangellaceae bacterium]|nr:YceH family protein [Wenzhouxiangellaceae bacterium]